jgi:ketosteroid isomerase-like protein
VVSPSAAAAHRQKRGRNRQRALRRAILNAMARADMHTQPASPERDRDPEANLDLVRRFYEHAQRGDWSQLALLAEDVVYRPVHEITGSDECRGRAEFRAYMEEFYGDAWGEISFAPTSYRIVGERVVVRLELTGRGRASDAAASARVFSVFTIRDGQIARLQDFTDRQEAIAAANRA